MVKSMKNWKDIETLNDELPTKGDYVSGEEQKDPQNEGTTNQLTKVQSSSRRSDIDPLAEPPDGGLNAWLKVMGCFLVYSNIWCLIFILLRSRSILTYQFKGIHFNFWGLSDILST